MKYEDLITLKENLEILADERDPKTGNKVDDTILKSTFNKRILTDATSIIEKLLKLDFNPTSIDRRKKYAFCMSDEDKEKISISEVPIPISMFAHRINEYVDEKIMKKIEASQITAWLLSQGYLSEVTSEDGRNFKILTEKSASIGITSEKRTSEAGRVYDVNLYNKIGQKFIIEHLQNITNNEITIL
ncbi:hypothetical protein SDC9_180564 [bioreactor metagenome]|uniref:Uncharacterized protein n=1 Tax=bioreactor metagenome TaxID=1076179 RepID=A0A645H235_9ZZZZ|nr:hypothetical protein [Oscillibacter sp.]